MSLLFETIRIVDGVPLHLGYHAARMNRSRKDLFGIEDDDTGEDEKGADADPIDLAAAIVIPTGLPAGIHRCRVLYGEKIDAISFEPYTPKVVRSLTLVEADDIRYAHKYTDRSAIERLRRGISGDDILMVCGGYITDTSYANIVFHGGGKWITPANPLLRGTARARLLDEGRIAAADISPRELGRFTRAVLINAMLDFDEHRWIDPGNIR